MQDLEGTGNTENRVQRQASDREEMRKLSNRLTFVIRAIAIVAILAVLSANFTDVGAHANAAIRAFVNEYSSVIIGSVLAGVLAITGWSLITDRKAAQD